jgi:hypothetical protein
MSADTRPGEIGRDEARRIAQETAALLKVADNEREFRECVLVALAELKVGQQAIKESFEHHVKQDDERFGNVTQRINVNSSGISKGAGVVAAVVVMIGVIMWFIDRMTP